jgi:hypothetical protein
MRHDMFLTFWTGADKRRRMWRRRGERYGACNIVSYNRYRGGSVVVWGEISVRSNLIVIEGNLTSRRYIDEVSSFPFYNSIMLSTRTTMSDHIWLGNVLDILRDHNIDWPARSPDMSPIEHV